MTIGVEGEVLVYALTLALAVSTGLCMGPTPSGPSPWTGALAGLLSTGVVAVGAFTLGASAPWVGPLFALVSLLTATLAAASAKGYDPAFADASFGSRIVAVLNARQGVRAEARAREADPGA